VTFDHNLPFSQQSILPTCALILIRWVTYKYQVLASNRMQSIQKLMNSGTE